MVRQKRILTAALFGLVLLTMASGAPARACDCNNNGAVDVGDALWIQQILAGIRPLPSPLGGCDVNADGSLTIIDALLLAQHMSGLINICPVPYAPVSVLEAPPAKVVCLEIKTNPRPGIGLLVALWG